MPSCLSSALLHPWVPLEGQEKAWMPGACAQSVLSTQTKGEMLLSSPSFSCCWDNRAFPLGWDPRGMC